MAQDKLSTLFSTLNSQGIYNDMSVDEFRTKMADSEKRATVYNGMRKWNIPGVADTFEAFSADLGFEGADTGTGIAEQNARQLDALTEQYDGDRDYAQQMQIRQNLSTSLDDMTARVQEAMRNIATPTRINSMFGFANNPERNELAVLQSLIGNLQKEIALPTKAEKEHGNKRSGLAAGLKTADLTSILTTGLSDAANQLRQSAALRKAAKGEPLSPTDQMYVDLYELMQEAEANTQALGGTTSGANIGRGVAGSIPYMTGMIATSGISGAARAATSNAVKAIAPTGVKNFIDGAAKAAVGKAIGKKAITKGVSTVGGAAVGALAALPFQSGMYRNFAEKTIEQYDVDAGVARLARPTSTFKRLYQSGAEAFTDIFTEQMGGLLTKSARFLGRELGSKASLLNKFDRFQQGRISQMAFFGGLKEEVEEELWAGFLSPLLSAKSAEERTESWRQMFSAQSLWETAMTTALMSGGFSVLDAADNAPATLRSRSLAKKSLSSIKDAGLRQTLYDGLHNKELEAGVRNIASYDWSNASSSDMANAIDYVRFELNYQVRRGYATAQQSENEYLKKVVAAGESIYYGKDGNTPSSTIIIATTPNGVYNVLSGDIDSTDPKATVIVRDAEGRRTQIANKEIQSAMSMPVSDYLSQAYAEIYGQVEQSVTPTQLQEDIADAQEAGVNPSAAISSQMDEAIEGSQFTLPDGRRGEVAALRPDGTVEINVLSSDGSMPIDNLEMGLQDVVPLIQAEDETEAEAQKIATEISSLPESEQENATEPTVETTEQENTPTEPTVPETEAPATTEPILPEAETPVTTEPQVESTVEPTVAEQTEVETAKIESEPAPELNVQPASAEVDYSTMPAEKFAEAMLDINDSSEEAVQMVEDMRQANNEKLQAALSEYEAHKQNNKPTSPNELANYAAKRKELKATIEALQAEDKRLSDTLGVLSGTTAQEAETPQQAIDTQADKSEGKNHLSHKESEIKPIGKSEFGPIYNQFKRQPEKAIEFILNKKDGEAVGALYHPEIGDISIVYGNNKAGLAKIERKHPEVLKDLQTILNTMKLQKESDNRVKLESETHFAVVSKEYNGVPRDKWLLTAYEKKSSAPNNTMDTVETTDGKQNDTATPQNTAISNDKDTTSEPISKETTEKSSNVPEQPTSEEPTTEVVAELQTEPEAKSETTVEPEPEPEAVSTSPYADYLDMDTLTLKMSDEEFEALESSNDPEAIKGYLGVLDKMLINDENTPFAGQYKIQDEFKQTVEQYGSREAVPSDIVADLTKRIQPYYDLSSAIYQRKYALQDALTRISEQEVSEKDKREAQEKAEYKKNAYYGFLNPMSSLSADTADKALKKRVKIGPLSYTVGDYIASSVISGDITLTTQEVPKYAGAPRAKWNRMDAQQQAADAERVKKSGIKTIYYVNSYDLGATAYNYAQYLRQLKEEGHPDLNPVQPKSEEEQMAEEAKARILKEGTGFDKDFELIAPKDVAFNKDISHNVDIIISKLAEKQASGEDLGSYGGFVKVEGYDGNAYRQVKDYLVQLKKGIGELVTKWLQDNNLNGSKALRTYIVERYTEAYDDAVRVKDEQKSDSDSQPKVEANSVEEMYDKMVAAHGPIAHAPLKRTFDLWAYTSDDKLRPGMTGIYHNADRQEAVATDAHILVASKTDYDEKFAGKVIGTNDKEIPNAVFPNYTALNTNDKVSIDVNVENLKGILGGIKKEQKELWTKEKEKGKKPGTFKNFLSDTVVYIKLGNGKVSAFKFSLFEDFVVAMEHIGADKIYGSDPERAIFAKSDKGLAMAMPRDITLAHIEWRDENLPGRNYYIDVSADASKAPETPKKEETKKPKASKADKPKATKPNKVSDHVATRKAAATARKEAQQSLQDFGEKIEGARKDVYKTLAKAFDDATLQSLIELPFSKSFKRPDLAKLVESGVLREEDALYAEAFMTVYLSTAKPKPTKSDERMARIYGRPTKVTLWAEEAYKRIQQLQEFMLADNAKRDEIIASFAKPEAEQAAREEREYQERIGGRGPLRSPNPVGVIAEVLSRIGYSAGDTVKIDCPLVRVNSTFSRYELRLPDGSRNYQVPTAADLEEAITNLVMIAKMRRGDNDVQYHKEQFTVKGDTPIKKGNGKFVVGYFKRNGGVDYKRFSSETEAKEFAAKQTGETVMKEEQEVVGYEAYKVRFQKPLDGDFFILSKSYPTREAALEAIENNLAELSAEANTFVAAKTDYEKNKKKAQDDLQIKLLIDRDTRKPQYFVSTKRGEQVSGYFNSSAEARKYLAENKEAIQKRMEELKEARSKFAYFSSQGEPRVGEDYRKGVDATPEMFQDMFGFRGVQFGNWTNARDRQEALNQAYDGFMDLASVLGVSPRALSLAGELGLAFGARGGGSAAAHYELKDVVINLTKTKGAGSLAHEWWHALDNYFARQAGISQGMATKAKQLPGVRPEVKKAFDDIVKTVNNSFYAKRSKAKGDYWGSEIELTARLFGEWVVYELAKTGRSNHFLSRGITPETFEEFKRINYAFYEWARRDKNITIMPYEEFANTPSALEDMPYPTKEETEQMGVKVRELFDTLQEREEGDNVVLYQREREGYSTTEAKLTTEQVLDIVKAAGIDVEIAPPDMVAALTESAQNPEYHIVYHGSGANFDKFDHSYMGSGEGAQAYGWGTYVTEVEGIGKQYAKKARNSDTLLLYKGMSVNTNGHYNPWRIIKDLFEMTRGKLSKMRSQADYYASLAESDSPMKPVWVEVYRILKEEIRSGDLKTDIARNLYVVDIPNPDSGSYLQWDGEIADEVVERLQDILTEEYGEDVMFAANLKHGQTGGRLYEKLAHALGSYEAASKFLARNGYVGIEYPAQYRSGGRADEAKNYVIFDESNLKIVDHIEFMRTPEGVIYGWTVNGKIYLTEQGLNPETPIHEYTHIWDAACRKENPELWAEGVALMKQTPLWEQVRTNPDYASISNNEDLLASEVHARLVAPNGANVLAEMLEQQNTRPTLFSRLKDWITQFWRWLRNEALPESKMSVDDFAKMPLKDLAQAKAQLQEREKGDRTILFRDAEVEYTEEEEAIIDKAIANGSYLKAPNGQPTNLTPKQWAQVRTKAFKEWFGNWEKAARIEKLRSSEDAVINGDEIAMTDDYKQNKKNALKYSLSFTGQYKNADTGAVIGIYRGRQNGGINEVLQHNYRDIAHIQSVAAIPQIIEKSIYIDSQPNYDLEKNPDVTEYLCYVCGLTIAGVEYTVLAKIAVDKNGNRYYDHNLTAIAKGKLIDIANNEQSAITSGFGTTPDTKSTTNSQRKYRELISILQTNFSKIVDANGEPKVVEHSTWNEDFYTFDIERLGESSGDEGLYGAGFYFGNVGHTALYGDRPIQAYLNMERPLVLPKDNIMRSFDYLVENFDKQGLRDIIVKGGGKSQSATMGEIIDVIKDVQARHSKGEYDELIEQMSQYWYPADDRVIEQTIFKKVGFAFYRALTPFIENNIGRREFTEALSKAGYDGVVYDNTEWVVYKPDQIKSATDNVGTFDSTNDDIRYRENRNVQQVEPREAIATRIIAEAQKLAATHNVPIEIHETREEITGNNSSAQRRKRNSFGWYDLMDDKIHIVLPSHDSVEELQKTFYHEAVAHYGLPKLLGEDQFTALCDNVWASLPSKVQARLTHKYPNASTQVRAEEYMATIAEGNITPGLFHRIIAFVREAFRKMGVNLRISDNDIAYILWRSKNNLQRARTASDKAAVIAADKRMRDVLFRDAEEPGADIAKEVTEELRKEDVPAESMDRIAKRKILEKYGEKYPHLQTLYETDNAVEEALKEIGPDMRVEGLRMMQNITEADNAIDEKRRLGRLGKRTFTEEQAREYDEKYGITKKPEQTEAAPLPPSDTDTVGVPTKELSIREKIYLAIFDAKAQVKQFQEALAAEGLNITSAMDYYSAENRTSSIAEVEKNRFQRNFANPLKNQINELAAAFDESGADPYYIVSTYALAEHSIERHDSGLTALSSEEGDNYWNLENTTKIVRRFREDIAEYTIEKYAKYGKDAFSEEELRTLSPTTRAKVEQGVEVDSLTDSEKMEIGEVKIEVLWRLINRLNDETLNIAQRAGLKSREEIALIKSHNWKYYVPLRNVDLEFENLTDPMEMFNKTFAQRRRSSTVFSPEAEGRTTKAADPFGQMIRTGQQFILVAETNKAKQRLLNLLIKARAVLPYSITSKYFEVGTRYLQKVYNEATGKFVWKEVSDIDGVPPYEEIEKSKWAREKIREHKSAMIQAAQEQDWDARSYHYQKMKEYEAEETVRTEVIDMDFNDEARISLAADQTRIVEVWVNGRKHLIKFKDQSIALAVNGLVSADAKVNGISDFFDKTAGTATRWLAKVRTQLSPDFIVTNAIRDFRHALRMHYLDVENGHLKGFTRNYNTKTAQAINRGIRGKASPLTINELRGYRLSNPAHIRELATLYGEDRVMDTLFDLFQSYGGQTGFAFAEDTKTIERDIRREYAREKAMRSERPVVRAWGKSRKAGSVVSEAFKMGSEVVENMSRFATFLANIEAGRTAEEAAQAAKEITVNFNRRGQWTKGIGSLYTFFNATMQAMAQVYRVGKENPKRLAVLATYEVAKGFAIAMLAELFKGDDDKEVPAYTLKENLVIPLPGGKYLKFSEPQTFSVFHGIGVDLAQAALGKISNAEVANNLVNSALEASLYGYTEGGTDMALEVFIPSIVEPFVDVYRNKNAFGSQIHPEDNWGLTPDSELGNRNTNELIYLICKSLNELGGGNEVRPAGMTDDGDIIQFINLLDANPANVEYIINQFAGGSIYGGKFAQQLWRLASALVSDSEATLKDVPMLNRILGTLDTATPNSAYYREKERIENAYSVMNKENKAGMEVDPIQLEYHARRRNYIKSIQKQIDAVRDVQNSYKVNSEAYNAYKEIVEDYMRICVKALNNADWTSGADRKREQYINSLYKEYGIESKLQTLNEKYGN